MSAQAPVSRRDTLITDMETLNIWLDSHLTLANSGPVFSRVLLQDLYRLSDQLLTMTPPRHWSPGRPLPPAPRRDDFNNIILKAGVTVSITSLRKLITITGLRREVMLPSPYRRLLHVACNASSQSLIVHSCRYTDSVFCCHPVRPCEIDLT